uniref:Helicase ATP-binding domain-containing protein n=1 Tax=Rhabditophanes sp. KR3021 TaxID=114890 RepID=A0AC35TMI4_9BILA
MGRVTRASAARGSNITGPSSGLQKNDKKTRYDAFESSDGESLCEIPIKRKKVTDNPKPEVVVRAKPKHILGAIQTYEVQFDNFMKNIEEISNQLEFGTISNPARKKGLNVEDLGDDEMERNNQIARYVDSPTFIKGKMRDYQIRGLNWLLSLRHNNVNGILADEMGLGKTLQTISIIAHAKLIEKSRNPSLIIVPLATLQNWKREVEKFSGLSVIILHGPENERKAICKDKLIFGKFDIAVTTYQMVQPFLKDLKRMCWEYVVIDEAHRIKNDETILSKDVRKIGSKHTLLLTGTPLQNNVRELFNLLSYLSPLFNDPEAVMTLFESQASKDEENVIKKLHQILKPFMLRRIKVDVENLLPKVELNIFVKMAPLQKVLYKDVLKKNINLLASKEKAGLKSLNGIMTYLRMVCSHPYTIAGVEERGKYSTEQHLIDNCGKLKILDKLLVKLKAQGSKVLVFAQFINSLDILEDYCKYRNHSFVRFDGSTPYEERVECIDRFQDPKSGTFAFLLNARSGGQGINLVAADAVIFYDSDWNPQMDAQATDRAHRIGQTKQVKVFRLITEGTIDERVFEISQHKLHLDNIIIQKGKAGETTKKMTKEEMVKIICQGAADICGDDGEDEINLDIESILKISEKKTKEVNLKFDKLKKPSSGSDMPFDTMDAKSNVPFSIYNFEGEDFKAIQRLREASPVIDKFGRSMRVKNAIESERKENESIHYNKALFPMHYIPYKKHHLVSEEFELLCEKNLNFFRKENGFKYVHGNYNPLNSKDANEEEINEFLEFCELQKMVDNAVPLTESEKIQLQKLTEEAFFNWNSEENSKMNKALFKYGNRPQLLYSEFPKKTKEEVDLYIAANIEYFIKTDNTRMLNAIRKFEVHDSKADIARQYAWKLYEKAQGCYELINLSFKSCALKKKLITGEKFSDRADKIIFFEFMDSINKQKINLSNPDLKQVLLANCGCIYETFKLKNGFNIFDCISFENIVERFVDQLELIKETIVSENDSTIVPLNTEVSTKNTKTDVLLKGLNKFSIDLNIGIEFTNQDKRNSSSDSKSTFFGNTSVLGLFPSQNIAKTSSSKPKVSINHFNNRTQQSEGDAENLSPSDD